MSAMGGDAAGMGGGWVSGRKREGEISHERRGEGKGIWVIFTIS